MGDSKDRGDENIGPDLCTSELMVDIEKDEAPKQVANVACLPGIVGYSLAMPDIHWGYGFAIGGVAAFDLDSGVVSPGGVGYDINCGVRLMRTGLDRQEIEPYLGDLVGAIYSNVPSGVGSSGRLHVKDKIYERVFTQGARWAVRQGFGDKAIWIILKNPAKCPAQIPTASAGKHLNEAEINLAHWGVGIILLKSLCGPDLRRRSSQGFGLFQGGVTVSIHTGSRGFGYQICEDYLRAFQKSMSQYGISLPDRQLCCVPIRSPEGQAYLEAMACAVNFAFANRQVIGEWIHRSFQEVLRKSPGISGCEPFMR